MTPNGVPNLETLWVAEWSEEQKCFNVDPLLVALKRNNRVFAKGKGGGYFPLGIYATHDEASAACEAGKEFLRKHRPRGRQKS